MNIQTLIPAISIAFLVTVALMFALHPLALRIGLVDHPGGRKRHDGTVPIIGGLAIFGGMIVGEILVGPPSGGYLSALVAGFLLVSIGVIDDRISLPPVTRIITQLAVVLIMIFGAGLQLSDIGDPFGTGLISMGRFTVLFTLVVSLTLINAYNFVDGLDGLAGSMALIALLSVAIVAGPNNAFGAAALIAAATTVGFLVFNFPVRWNRSVRSFMGDAGSTLLGLSIVWLTLGIAQGEARVISPVHCLWFAAVPIFDCLSCFVCRILKKKSPFTPGRDHFHHALRRGELGGRQILAILAGLQITYASVGLLGHYFAVPDVALFIAWSVLGLSQRVVIRNIAKYHRLYISSQSQRRKFAG